MTIALRLSPDTQTTTPAEHIKALELALDTLEAVHETVEASGDQKVALALQALLDDLAEQHLVRLFETTGSTIYDATSPKDMAELRAREHSRVSVVNASGGEA